MRGLSERLPDRKQRVVELARDLTNAAYLRGDFVMSSGLRSSYYFEKYLFETKPAILRRIAAFMSEHIPLQTDRLAGPELGAVALATALSLESGLPFVIVRRQVEDRNSSRMVEGELYFGEKVVVIEDVLTTGAAAVHAADQIQLMGGEVVKILAVIDRGQGASRAIASAGYASQALFTHHQLEKWGGIR